MTVDSSSAITGTGEVFAVATTSGFKGLGRASSYEGIVIQWPFPYNNRFEFAGVRAMPLGRMQIESMITRDIIIQGISQ